jgi:cellulose synthase operon protein C
MRTTHWPAFDALAPLFAAALSFACSHSNTTPWVANAPPHLSPRPSARLAEIEEIQRTRIHLKGLISATPDDSDQKPELIERLTQEILKEAKIYDTMAFDMLDLANAADSDGNASKAADLRRQVEDNQKRANQARAEANKYYLQLINEYPLYPNKDKILFYFSYNLKQMGQMEDAIAVAQQLVRELPDSQYAQASLIAIADAKFSNEDVQGALENYLTVADSGKTDPNVGYAMYKIGWCYFNLGEPRKALAQFEKVINYNDQVGGSKSLREEAVKDLVKAFSLWPEGDPRKARGYLSKFVNDDKDKLDDLMERLAQFYTESGQIDRAIFVYRDLIKGNSKSFKSVHYQTQIMYAVETQNDVNKTASEIFATVERYTKAKDDPSFSDKTPERLEQSYQEIESYTRETAKWYHRVAVQTKQPLYYALAYELYKIYVESFKEAQDNYEMIFYYAELLYGKALTTKEARDLPLQMKLYAEAAKRYDQVIDINPDGPYSKEAAYGSVLSYDKLTKVPSAECPALPEVTAVVDKQGNKTYPLIDVPECRTRFVIAADRYMKVAPDTESAPDIKFYASRVFYDYNQFPEAITRFGNMVDEFPDHPLGLLSAQLLLDALYITEQYKDMYAWVKKLQGIPALNQGELASTLSVLAVELSFKFCFDEEENKNWKAAAECYENFVREYPDSAEKGPQALWNAGIAWEKAFDIGKAIEVRVQLLNDYGGSELAPDTIYRIGQNWHGIATFSEAAKFYEILVMNFPGHKESKVALTNAAAFRDGLGQVDEAIRDYDLFVEKFGKAEPPDRVEVLKYKTGEIYFKNKRFKDAIERFEAYRQEFRAEDKGSAYLKLHANLMIAKSYWAMKQQGSAKRYFSKIADRMAEKGFQKRISAMEKSAEKDPKIASELSQIRDIAAEASFMLGELVFAEAMAVQLFEEGQYSENKLNRALEKKLALIKEAAPLYEAALITYKSPNWGLAGLCRIGMMQHDIATQLLKSPVPPGLNEEERLMYMDIIEGIAFEVEDGAAANYVIALQKSAELGWFNRYTTEAQQRLFTLKPDEYSSAAEILAQPDKSLVRFHNVGFFDDVEVAAGRKKTKKRGAIDLDASEADKLDDATSLPPAPPASPDTPPSQ